MPPPNITGNLHLGHCLDLIPQDFLVRYFYLKGQAIYWISGMDHAGIATQKKIESFNLPNIQNIEQKRNYTFNTWYPQTKKSFFQQWEKLGLLVDYENTRFTLDPVIQEQVKQAFIQLYNDVEKGESLEAAAKREVFEETNLANKEPDKMLDIKFMDKTSQEAYEYAQYFSYSASSSKSDYLKMLDGEEEKLTDSYLLVATSRPETVFADVALFVNPQDQRYQKYIGQKVQHPITQKVIPILTDEKIIIDFGTGVLKCTPGHDFFDYELGKKYNLPLVSCYDEKGILNSLAGK
ncbi:20033_t:CDS:2 [Entrophospora sp. SA101]|nr:14609_t:CDS:2 [Entrophospora sp. SA101]CAJ0747110.1 20033_t:CDS:2 [Entrophospora sp. SA101]